MGNKQTTKVLNPYCRNCRNYGAAFLRDGVELFRISTFRTPTKRDAAMRDWESGKNMAYMAENHL